MRLAIATSSDDTLGGIFAKAYYDAGGPAPTAVFVMDDRRDLAYPRWSLPWVSLRLFSVTGVARIAAGRMARRPLLRRDRDAGLHLNWLDTLAPPSARIPCRTLEAPDTLDALRKLNPDLLVSIGAPRIIAPTCLTVPRLGALNVHNATLPRYRGHFGTFWEVLHGESHAGISIHEMAVKVDAGRILATEQLDVATIPTFLDLLVEKKRRGGRLLARLLRDIEVHQVPIARMAGVTTRSSPEAYFGWPALADVRRFAYRRA